MFIKMDRNERYNDSISYKNTIKPRALNVAFQGWR